MKASLLLAALLAAILLSACKSPAPAAAKSAAAPADPYLDQFHPVPAPAAQGLLLRRGDRVAICGDSITEQKMYSRIIETYLTACVPDLDISVRQYGWSGETAPGFLARMTNDCLRFQPTLATTCYGMNDHGYRPYTPEIGQRYHDAMTSIVRAFKQAGARVVLGSPGCIGRKPDWGSKDPGATSDAMNLNLCELRNIDVRIARTEQVGFADVFWPMLRAGVEAQRKCGTNFAIAGKDGVHPDWAGQLVMAYAFLHALGLDGDIGTFTVDLKAGRAATSAGHEIGGFKGGVLHITSRRYPFCAEECELSRDNCGRAGMALVPFNEELNRLMLVVRHAPAKQYRVTWGGTSRSFTREQLARGVNLTVEFPANPFGEAFGKVSEAVLAKQAYETKQIKQQFHGDAGKQDMETTVERTEAERAPLAAAIKATLVPLTHTIEIRPE